MSNITNLHLTASRLCHISGLLCSLFLWHWLPSHLELPNVWNNRYYQAKLSMECFSLLLSDLEIKQESLGWVHWSCCKYFQTYQTTYDSLEGQHFYKTLSSLSKFDILAISPNCSLFFVTSLRYIT